MTEVRPAGAHTVRRLNSALVLGAIAGSPGISRAGVAARTGLTKATVSSLVDRMIAADLIIDGGPQRREGPGRRGTALSLSPSGPYGLGVEIGVDYVATCLVDFAGRVRARRTRAADNRARSSGQVLSTVARSVRATLREATRERGRVGGIGVAVPGLVESATGLLRLAPNLGWRDVDLRGELRRRAELDDLAVLVGNEANFAALAELWQAGPGDARDFVHVSGEIGIGAGIVIDGAVFEGVRGFGGEIGHLSVNPAGPECSCGSRGCLERMAGQEEILRRAGITETAAPATLIDELVRRLTRRDRKSLSAVDSTARWLGIGLSTVINVLDVPTVVLGGSYARIAPWLGEPLRAELDRRVVSAAWTPVRVVPSALGTEAAVSGAAGAVVRAIIADPDSFVSSETG